MNILFRVDCSDVIGYGHLVRCSNLAKTLLSFGHTIYFLTSSREEYFFPLKVEGANYIFTDKQNDFENKLGDPSTWCGRSTKKDAELVEEKLKELCVDLLIVDHYGVDLIWFKSLSKHSKIFLIDDLEDRPLSVDVILNQNTKNLSNKYSLLNDKELIQFLGPDFALINDKYAKLRSQSFEKVSEVRSVLIFFGGGDITGETLKSVSALINLKFSGKVKIILNKKARDYHSVLDAIRTYKNYELLEFTNNMPLLVQEADLVLGACGVSTWERACLNKASITVSVVENQKSIVKTVKEKKISHYLGDGHKTSTEDWEKELRYCLNNVPYLNELQENSQSITDGQGCLKIAKFLSNWT